jgi:hypothetical protein
MGRNCLTIFCQSELFSGMSGCGESKWDRPGREVVYSGSHFKSIFQHGDILCLIVYNFDWPSFVLKLTWPELEIRERIPFTSRWADSVWVMPVGHLLVCDAMRGTLLDLMAWVVLWRSALPSSITRGLASDERILLVRPSTMPMLSIAGLTTRSSICRAWGAFTTSA